MLELSEINGIVRKLHPPFFRGVRVRLQLDELKPKTA